MKYYVNTSYVPTLIASGHHQLVFVLLIFIVSQIYKKNWYCKLFMSKKQKKRFFFNHLINLVGVLSFSPVVAHHAKQQFLPRGLKVGCQELYDRAILSV